MSVTNPANPYWTQLGGQLPTGTTPIGIGFTEPETCFGTWNVTGADIEAGKKEENKDRLNLHQELKLVSEVVAHGTTAADQNGVTRDVWTVLPLSLMGPAGVQKRMALQGEALTKEQKVEQRWVRMMLSLGYDAATAQGLPPGGVNPNIWVGRNCFGHYRKSDGNSGKTDGNTGSFTFLFQEDTITAQKGELNHLNVYRARAANVPGGMGPGVLPGGNAAGPQGPGGFAGNPAGGFGAPQGAPQGFGGQPQSAPQGFGAPGGFGAPQGAPGGFGAPQGAPGGFGAPQGAPQGAAPAPGGWPGQGGFGAPQGAPGGALGGLLGGQR